MKYADKTLKQRIINYLRARPGQWINGGDFERMAIEEGYKASNADRRLRELCEQYRDMPHGVKAEERRGRFASSMWYTYVPSVYERLNARMQAA